MHTGGSVDVGTGRELVISRIIHAPRESVFKAWTDPKHLARWWGPRGFTNPVCELDLRPGGAISIEMRGPDGVTYPMKGVFQEITPPERLVFLTSAFEVRPGNPRLEVLTSVTFGDLKGNTKLVVKATVIRATPDVADAVEGTEEGWSGSLERLESLLSENPGTSSSVATRWQSWGPRLQSVLRIVAAIMFMMAGTMKTFAFPIGIPPSGGTAALLSEVGVAGILETFGGALMLLGLFTRPVAFILSGEMAVAYFQFHAPNSVWPIVNGGVPAALYCFVWLYFSAAGAGPWSMDAMWRRNGFSGNARRQD